MANIKYIGGVRLDDWNATFPFASIEFNKFFLRLKLKFGGEFTFNSNNLIKLEKVGFTPISQGIRIHHKSADYPEKVIFWTLRNPNTIIKEIEDNIYIPSDQDTDLSTIKFDQENIYHSKLFKAGFLRIVSLFWGIPLNITLILFYVGGKFPKILIEWVLIITSLFSALSLLNPNVSKLIIRKNTSLPILKKRMKVLLLVCIVLYIILELLANFGIVV